MRHDSHVLYYGFNRKNAGGKVVILWEYFVKTKKNITPAKLAEILEE